MTLHELVGSLIVGKVAGCRLTDDEVQILLDKTISGVTLFKENAESISQLVRLINTIGKLREGAIVAVDQEGGAVQRFDHVLSSLPSQMALAACPDPSNAIEKIVEINCRQLGLLGVNCLLAPVLDICCNPSDPIIGSRSFGAEPVIVGELGKIYAKAVKACGLIPVGKHFPGHGDVGVDSHLDIPILSVGREQLLKRELVPFQTCIADLPAIMVGHISVPAIDMDGVSVPASLSHRVVTELLRKQLGFEGVIMTDDMAMGAIGKHYDLGEAAVRAIAAGVDQILIGGNVGQILAVHAALVTAVEEGKLTDMRLEQSAARIAKFAKLSNSTAKQIDQTKRIEMLEQCITDDSRVSLEVMQSAISLLRGTLPDVSHGRWNTLVPDHPRYKFDLYRQLGKQFSELQNITEQRFPLDPSAEDISAVINKVKEENADCILLGFRGSVYTGQIKLAKELNRELSACGQQLYCIETDAPSGLALSTELKNVVATFDPSDAAMEALSRLLRG
jgi:beta-N-acetylhexosaminidase